MKILENKNVWKSLKIPKFSIQKIAVVGHSVQKREESKKEEENKSHEKTWVLLHQESVKWSQSFVLNYQPRNFLEFSILEFDFVIVLLTFRHGFRVWISLNRFLNKLARCTMCSNAAATLLKERNAQIMAVDRSPFGRMSRRFFFYLEISKQHEVFGITSSVDRHCLACHIIEKDKAKEKEEIGSVCYCSTSQTFRCEWTF